MNFFNPQCPHLKEMHIYNCPFRIFNSFFYYNQNEPTYKISQIEIIKESSLDVWFVDWIGMTETNVILQQETVYHI